MNSNIRNRFFPIVALALAVASTLSCFSRDTKAQDGATEPLDQKTEKDTTITPKRIGIIGAGWLGGTVGRLLVEAGYEVMFSSRHPENLKAMAAELGSRASVGSPKQAAAYGEIVLLSVPFEAVPQVGNDLKEELNGKIVLDATNPWHSTSDLAKESEKIGVAEITARYFPYARLVRAFSAVDATVLEASAKRSSNKVAVPIAGDDQQALQVAARLVLDTGCEPVVVGNLASAVKFQPGHPGFRAHLTAAELRKLLGLPKE